MLDASPSHCGTRTPWTEPIFARNPSTLHGPRVTLKATCETLPKIHHPTDDIWGEGGSENHILEFYAKFINVVGKKTADSREIVGPTESFPYPNYSVWIGGILS